MPGRTVAFAIILAAAAVAAGACSHEKPKAALSTVTLVNDPLALDRVVTLCNQRPTTSVDDAQCRNARAAVERLAQGDTDGKSRQRQAQLDFERERETLRARAEVLRQDSGQREATDPYALPFVPPEPERRPEADSAAKVAASAAMSTHQ